MYPLDIIQTHYNKILLSGFPLSTDRASLDHNYTQSFLSGHKTSKKLGKCTICRPSSIPMILNIMITEVSDPLGHTLLIFLSRESSVVPPAPFWLLKLFLQFWRCSTMWREKMLEHLYSLLPTWSLMVCQGFGSGVHILGYLWIRGY